jgi:sugar/nucleoside kinase (ribokinase family)
MPAPLCPIAADARPFDLLGLGQISLDRVASVERLPAPGGKATLRGERELPGGQVATALLAATRLGLRCALVGAVGGDAAGERSLSPLREAGVDLRGVVRIPSVPTRQAWVLVENESGERTIFERRDPRLRIDPRHLDARALESARVLLLDLEHPEASQQAAERARSAGIPVILDADRVSPAALRLVAEVDFPIVSESFAEEFSSDASLEDKLRALAGPNTRMAVVTRGARGSLAWRAGRIVRTSAPQVAAVDTTGAGDVFRGAFAWALLQGMDAERVLWAANAAAASSCRGEGAQGALPGRDELEASLQGGRTWRA